MLKPKKLTIIAVVLCIVLGMAGCAAQQPPPAQDQLPAAPETAGPPDASVAAPDAPPAASEPAAPQGAAAPAVKDNAPAPGQASLALGRSHDEKTDQITDLATTFKAGEKFYYRFDNGGPFGVESILLQYEAMPGGEVLNKYSIAVDPARAFDWATISFKEPGQYRLVFMIGNEVRAGADFSIE